ncbi:unnamed protein product, partial [Larinioides sclopetarius]
MMKVAVLVVLLVCVWCAVGETEGTYRVCGRQLSQLLSVVCDGDYGEPRDAKRSAKVLMLDDNIVKPEEYVLGRQLRVQRGVADECCHRQCTWTTLQSY